MTTWQLYWLTRLSGIQALLGVFAGMSTLGLIVAVIGLGEARRTVAQEAAMRFIKVFGVLLILFTTGVVFIPSTKEAAFIIVAPKLYDAVSKNEGLKQIPDKVIALANTWLDALKPGENK